jgi:putative membrane protein
MRKFRAYLSRPALIAAVLFSCSAAAQTADRPEEAVLKSIDRAFIEKAARAGLDAVEISRAAAERSSNALVREYAQMMVNEQEAANDAIALLALNKTVALPSRGNEADRWLKRDTRSFDQDYLRKMVSEHEDEAKLFEKETKEGEDAETVAFARKNLPKVLQHLQLAKDLQKLTK